MDFYSLLISYLVGKLEFKDKQRFVLHFISKTLNKLNMIDYDMDILRPLTIKCLQAMKHFYKLKI